MRLLARNGGQTLWHLRAGQRDLLLVVLEASATRPPRDPGLSRKSPDLDERYRSDLAEHLAGERALAQETLSESLKDPVRCQERPDGHQWLLDPDQTEVLVQTLNAIRIGAWERLGCPADPGETDGPLQPGTLEFLDRWLLAIGSRFLEVVMTELESD